MCDAIACIRPSGARPSKLVLLLSIRAVIDVRTYTNTLSQATTHDTTRHGQCEYCWGRRGEQHEKPNTNMHTDTHTHTNENQRAYFSKHRRHDRMQSPFMRRHFQIHVQLSHADGGGDFEPLRRTHTFLRSFVGLTGATSPRSPSPSSSSSLPLTIVNDRIIDHRRCAFTVNGVIEPKRSINTDTRIRHRNGALLRTFANIIIQISRWNSMRNS